MCPMPGTAEPRTVGEIPGWFSPADMKLFQFFLREAAPEEHRDLLELGAYLGKSAAHMGAFLRPGETFYVADLFDPAFKGLTREDFERNYRAVRGDLPVVLQGPSAQAADHVKPGSVRFVHVDASHAYDDVVADLEMVRNLVADGAVVVFDDYRSRHTPGVAAAVWGAVTRGELAPICLSGQKFYGVFGDSQPHVQQLLRWLPESSLRSDTQSVAGHQLVRIIPPGRKPAPSARPSTPPQVERLERIDERLARVERLVRKVARQQDRTRPMTAVRRALGRARPAK